MVPQIISSPTPNPSPSGGEVIGFGEAVGVMVTRPYLFGLIRLPVYTNTLGDISIYHDAFFYFIVILTVIFIIIEVKNRFIIIEVKNMKRVKTRKRR